MSTINTLNRIEGKVFSTARSRKHNFTEMLKKKNSLKLLLIYSYVYAILFCINSIFIVFGAHLKVYNISYITCKRIYGKLFLKATDGLPKILFCVFCKYVYLL